MLSCIGTPLNLLCIASQLVLASQMRAEHREERDFRSEFNRAVQQLREESIESINVLGGGNYNNGWVDHWRMDGFAMELSHGLVDKDCEFLVGLLDSQNAIPQSLAPNVRVLARPLALLTLAHSECGSVEEVLYKSLVPARDQIDWDVLIAISFMPIEKSRAILSRCLDDIPGEAGSGGATRIGYLAAIVGDSHTITTLEKMQNRLADAGFIMKNFTELNERIHELRDRLRRYNQNLRSSGLKKGGVFCW